MWLECAQNRTPVAITRTSRPPGPRSTIACVSTSRADWPVRRYRLGEEPPEDLSDVTTAEARIAMMAALAREGWAAAGKAYPAYARDATPTRLFRPGEHRDDE